MTNYIKNDNAKIVNTRGNFDSNINYFSGRQVGTALDYTNISLWSSTTYYATAAASDYVPTSNWVRVASGGDTYVYKSLIATNLGNIPGATQTTWKLMANTVNTSPYSDIKFTWLAGDPTYSATAMIDSAKPTDALYVYNLTAYNNSPTTPIDVTIYGKEVNLGYIATAFPIVATFNVPYNQTVNKLVSGLYINGDIRIKASNSLSTANGYNLYIRIKEVN